MVTVQFTTEDLNTEDVLSQITSTIPAASTAINEMSEQRNTDFA